MKTISTQKEILLVTGTTFAQRERYRINILNVKDHLTKQQMLEEACLNDMLMELLPELSCEQSGNEKLYLWLIRHGHAFIQLELCEEPLIIDREFSLDPYLFLSAQIFN